MILEKLKNNYEDKYQITIHISSKDRHSELALLLQSLRTQIFQNWNLVILDDNSGTPILSCRFLGILQNMIRMEGHDIKVIRHEKSMGVCYARNLVIEQDIFDTINKILLTLRLDDDVLLEPDYILRLLHVIEEGYDIASGITPTAGMPLVEREIRFVKPIINLHKFDNEGNLILAKDECGYGYIEDEILPTPHFRSCALIKKEIFSKIKYKTNLSMVGFREEGFLSFEAILAGYKIGVNTKAIAWHQCTPSGGCRYIDYTQKVAIDDQIFKEWCKENKIWTKNLRYTEAFLGYIFLDVIVMGILGVISIMIFGNSIIGSSLSVIFAFGYISSYYNFYNYANNGLKAHKLFKIFKKELNNTIIAEARTTPSKG